MDIIFTNSENSKHLTFDLYRLLLKLSDKINLKRSDKFVALSNLVVEIYLDLNLSDPRRV